MSAVGDLPLGSAEIDEAFLFEDLQEYERFGWREILDLVAAIEHFGFP